MLCLVMAQMHGYEIVLWVLGLLMPAAVIVSIYRAGLANEYPALVRFNLATISSAIVGAVALRFSTAENYALYCYVYWCASIITDCCALAVTLEIFRDIFKPYEALKNLASVLFRWTLGVLVVVCVVSALTTGSFKAPDVVSNIGLMFDRGLQILQCGIVLFLLLTNRYLGISFRERVFGIAVGFGTYAAVCLLVLSVANWVPRSAVGPLGAVMNVVAVGMYGVWLVYFHIPQPQRRLSEAMPESRRWEYALSSIHAPAPDAMFLSSIDRTVERLLTKNNVATQAKPKEDKHWFGD